MEEREKWGGGGEMGDVARSTFNSMTKHWYMMRPPYPVNNELSSKVGQKFNVFLLLWNETTNWVIPLSALHGNGMKQHIRLHYLHCTGKVRAQVMNTISDT